MVADATEYVRAGMVMKGEKFRLKCPCGGMMRPMRGRSLDGLVHRDYMWHMCKKDREHITEPIEISDVYWNAFTKTF